MSSTGHPPASDHPRTEREKQARFIRIVRKIHRTAGALLFAFFLVIGTTGFLLGIKKHTGGVILPKSYTGSSLNMKDWQPLDTLHQVAVATLHGIDPTLSTELERIDARPDKGMVKFVFIDNYIGIQLDLATAEVLHIERRNSDIIENIHDGSIIDYALGTEDEQFKLGYTMIMGAALITFSVSGFWLWYGPKRLRKNKSARRSKTQASTKVLETAA
jgi:uncharacterized iron-regulated membrane protein